MDTSSVGNVYKKYVGSFNVKTNKKIMPLNKKDEFALNILGSRAKSRPSYKMSFLYGNLKKDDGMKLRSIIKNKFKIPSNTRSLKKTTKPQKRTTKPKITYTNTKKKLTTIKENVRY